jgi:glycosyltransferase involved in cell wall biosynthesis
MQDSHETNPTLSIIVPVHQMAGKLEKLRSWIEIAAQQDIEIIIVHDKGDLLTGEELKSIIKAIASQRIHFLEGSYQGPGVARNTGKKIATGKFLNFTDSDDLPDTFELLRMCSQLIENRKSVCIGGYKVVNSNKRRGSTAVLGSGFSHVNRIKLIYQTGIWRFVILKEAAQEISFGDERMGEDQYFISQLPLGKREVCFSKSICYTYFTGQESQLTNEANKFVSLRKTLREMANLPRIQKNQLGVFLLLRMELTLLMRMQSRSQLNEILEINRKIGVRKSQYLIFIYYFVSGLILFKSSRLISNVRRSEY